MRLARRLLLAGLCLAAFSGEVLAAEPYVTAKTLDIIPLLAPPPVKGSAADEADMNAVLAAQASASDARKAQALKDSDEDVYTVFAAVLGETFTPAATPRTNLLFERIGQSEDDTIDPAKPYFGRVRPWLANPAVQAIAKPTKSPSYPSGHTTRVTAYAVVMAMLVPEKAHEIWARAADYAQSRVIGGMHFPADIEAGWRAGSAMAAVLIAQPAFQADFAPAKEELRKVLGYN